MQTAKQMVKITFTFGRCFYTKQPIKPWFFRHCANERRNPLGIICSQCVLFLTWCIFFVWVFLFNFKRWHVVLCMAKKKLFFWILWRNTKECKLESLVGHKQLSRINKELDHNSFNAFIKQTMLLSQIGQTLPPPNHDDSPHLSMNHTHLSGITIIIKTPSKAHTFLHSVSSLVSTKWTHAYAVQAIY